MEIVEIIRDGSTKSLLRDSTALTNYY